MWKNYQVTPGRIRSLSKHRLLLLLQKWSIPRRYASSKSTNSRGIEGHKMPDIHKEPHKCILKTSQKFQKPFLNIIEDFSLIITESIVDVFLSTFQIFRNNWYQEDWWMNTSGRSKTSLEKHTWPTFSKDPCFTLLFSWNSFLSVFQNSLISYLYEHRHAFPLFRKSCFSCGNFFQHFSAETNFCN